MTDHATASHRRRVARPGAAAAAAARASRGPRRLLQARRLSAARPMPTRCSSEVDLSGLLGRGGAAFPLAVKLRTVRDAGRRGGDTVVVANGEEGEPASVKDRWLLRHRPHLVLDGLRLAARIVGARHAHVYVSDRACRRSGRHGAGELAPQRSTASRSACVTVEPGYVAGEETAAVRAINGGPAKPTDKPPRPFEQGVGGLPDAGQQRRDAGQPAVHPPARRAELPRSRDRRCRRDLPGHGHRRRPARRRSTRSRTAHRSPSCLPCTGSPPSQVRGVLMGGYFAGLLNRRDTRRHARPRDACAGSAAAWAAARSSILTDDCPVAVAASVLAYFDRENAGQCGSCFNGTAAMAAVAGGAARRRRHRRGPRPAAAVVGGAARPRRVRHPGRRHQRRRQPARSVPRRGRPPPANAARLPRPARSRAHAALRSGGGV